MGRDHALLRERIGRLGGPRGLTRLDAALAAARATAGSPQGPPGTPPASPGGPSPRAGVPTGSPRPQSPFLASPAHASSARSRVGSAPAGIIRSPRPALRRLDFGDDATEPAQGAAGNARGGLAGGAGGAAAHPAANPGPDANTDMMWALLHDLRWQVPTDEAEALWADAAGDMGAQPACVVALLTCWPSLA